MHYYFFFVHLILRFIRCLCHFNRYTIICYITYTWLWLSITWRYWSFVEMWCWFKSAQHANMAKRRRRSSGNLILLTLQMKAKKKAEKKKHVFLLFSFSLFFIMTHSKRTLYFFFLPVFFCYSDFFFSFLTRVFVELLFTWFTKFSHIISTYLFSLFFIIYSIDIE